MGIDTSWEFLPLTYSPQRAVFWFIAEPGAEPKPRAWPATFQERNCTCLPDRYFNLPFCEDEFWRNLQGSADFVGFLDATYFPSGDVSCRPDGSASYIIDPAFNTKAFFDVLSTQTRTLLTYSRTNAHLTHRSPPAKTTMPKLNQHFDGRASQADTWPPNRASGGTPRTYLTRDT